MTLRELAEQIQRDGGDLSRHLSPQRADGTYLTTSGSAITAAQLWELRRILRRNAVAQPSEAERAKQRARAAAARHDNY